MTPRDQSHDDPSGGSVAFAGYALDGELGQGGFGVVYRATRVRDGRSAAIKLASAGDEARSALLREQRALEEVGAPIAPALLDSGVLPDGRPWIALELIAWSSLDQLRAFSVAQAVKVTAAIARVVAQLHARGLVHGDLKPPNLFVSPDLGDARLIDFGLARRADDATIDDIDILRGTPIYMAPEQCDRSGSISTASDVYALGVILYELVAGHPPFEGDNAAELQQAHLARRPPPIPPLRAIPAPLEAVLRACLAKLPADRPTSASLAHELARWADELSSVPASAPSTTTAPPEAIAKPAVPAGVARRMGLLAFEPRCDAKRLVQLLEAMGGRVGHVTPARTIALFDSEASQAPFSRLVRAAQTLAHEGAIASGIAGVAEVTVHQRRGREVLLSPAFSDPAFAPNALPASWLAILPTAEHLVGDDPLQPVPGSALAGVPLDEETYRNTSMTVHARRRSSVGRGPLVEQVAAACRDANARRQPALQVLVGESGVGKSHVAALLANELPAKLGATVLAWRAPENLLGEPFELAARMLRALLDLPSTAPADGGESLIMSHAGDAWPAVALALGWIAPTAPALARFSAPGSLSAAVTTALANALVGRARESALAVVVDDIHHAEDIVLDALDLAVLPERASRLAVVALGRSLPRAAWGRRAANFAVVDIAPLADADADALVRELLLPVEHVPREAVARIVERSRGIPRLLHEIVRGLRADGSIRVEPTTGRAILELDRLDDELAGSTVDWIAERELRALPATLLGHARLASLLGGAFTVDEFAGVVALLDRAGHGDAVPLDPRVGLDRLRKAGLLVDAESGRYDFRYPLLREAVARSTPDAFRDAVHEAAYEHHAQVADHADPSQLARLALHAERSTRPARAIAPLLSLGKGALARHLYLSADLQLTRALALLSSEDARRGHALHDRGTARYRLGRYADALDDLRAARALAASSTEQAAIVLDEAMALDWMVDYASARAAVAEAERLLADESLPRALEIRLVVARGRCELREGSLERAVGHLRQADALGGALGEVAYESRVVALLMLAPVLAMLGHVDESAQRFAEATALCEAHHDRMHLISVIQNQIPLHMAHQDLEGALASVERARSLSRELGLVASEYRQLANLADIHIQAGRADAALAQVDRISELATLVHGDAHPPDVALLRARAQMLDGRLDDARATIASITAGAEGTRAFDRLGATEQLLVRAIALGTSAYDRDGWHGLAEACEPLVGQSDVVEIYDLMQRAARAARDDETARFAHERFVRFAEQTPCFYRRRNAA